MKPNSRQIAAWPEPQHVPDSASTLSAPDDVTSPGNVLEFQNGRFPVNPGRGVAITSWRRNHIIFRQGDAADSMFYIRRGKVKLTVASDSGREAVIGLPDAGQFFGEACLATQQHRGCTAIALTECSIFRLDKAAAKRMLRDDPSFAETVLTHSLNRTIRMEEDLVDQFFNNSETRLARTLLRMANFADAGEPERAIPRLSHETLAAMIGTTRSRVSFFMNRFRQRGYIEYGATIQIHSTLLDVVLGDSAGKSTHDSAEVDALIP